MSFATSLACLASSPSPAKTAWTASDARIFSVSPGILNPSIFFTMSAMFSRVSVAFLPGLAALPIS